MCCHGRGWVGLTVLSIAMVVGGCRAPTGSPVAVGTAGPDGAVTPPKVEMLIKDPNTLMLALGVFGGSLDPAAAYGDSQFALQNLYDPLIFYDGTSTDRFIPWLATDVPSIENGLIRDGGRTIVFPIRKGVTFQAGPVMGPDGQPIPGSGELSPEDVAYTFQRGMLSEPLGGPQWMFLSSLLGANTVLSVARRIEEASGGKKAADVTSIDDVSPSTRYAVCQATQDAVQVDGDNVVFHLSEPNASFLQILVGSWGSILDKEWVMAAVPGETSRGKPGKKSGWNGDCSTWRVFYGRKLEESELNDATNGTGPFKLTYWDATDGWIMQRNDAFWKGPAHLKSVVSKVVPDFTSRLLMYQNGDVDVFAMSFDNMDQVRPLVAEGRLREFTPAYGKDMSWLRFNQRVDPVRNGFIGSGKLDGEGIPPDFFSDIDVRKGFAYSIDFDTIIKERMLGNGTRATGPIHHGVFGFDPQWTGFPKDLNLAKEHFKKAFGGKLWDVGFTMVFLADQALSLRLERDLLSINPKFKISIDSKVIDSLANTANDLVPLDTPSWLEDFHDPDNWAYPLLGSDGFFSSMSDIAPDLQKQLDDLLVAARREQNPTKRAALYSQIGQISNDNALLVPGVESLPVYWEAPYLKGQVYNPAFPGMYFWPIYKSNE